MQHLLFLSKQIVASVLYSQITRALDKREYLIIFLISHRNRML